MEDTRFKIDLEVRYSARLHELHKRLFSRIRMWDNILKISSGCAGFVSFVNAAPIVGAAVSLLVAALAICDQVINYGSLAARHADAQRAYLDLLAKNGEATAQQLRAKLAGVDAKYATLNELESLRLVAQNDVLQSAGEPARHERTESWRERFMRAIA